MDFYTFEDTEANIRVFLYERLSFFKRISVDDDQASSPVCQGASEHDPTLGVERFQAREVLRSMELPFCLSIRTVEAKNDKFHRESNIFCSLASSSWRSCRERERV